MAPEDSVDGEWRESSKEVSSKPTGTKEKTHQHSCDSVLGESSRVL